MNRIWPRIQEQLQRELSAAKENRRLVQTDVADRIGKHQSTISRIANWPYKDSPRIEAVVQAVLALDISLSDFFRKIEQGDQLTAGTALAPARLITPTRAQAIITHLRGIIRALEGRPRPK